MPLRSPRNRWIRIQQLIKVFVDKSSKGPQAPPLARRKLKNCNDFYDISINAEKMEAIARESSDFYSKERLKTLPPKAVILLPRLFHSTRAKTGKSGSLRRTSSNYEKTLWENFYYEKVTVGKWTL